MKQSICTSESIDTLDWFEEAFYYRLIVNVDDYGCFDARPKILKAALFPLREVRLSVIEKTVGKLADEGLVRLYTVDGKPFLCLPTWGEHQRVRASKHKFPTPDMADPAASCGELPPSAASCGELRQVAASCGELPPSAASCGLTRAGEESESESKSKSISESRIQKPESESESEIDCTELPGGSAAPQEAAEEPHADVQALILNDGSEWRPTAEDVGEWMRLYPGIDVQREFARMRQWCMDNPKKRKTKSGIRRFARGWLDREQNRGWRGRAAPADGQGPTGADLYMQYAMEAAREEQAYDTG